MKDKTIEWNGKQITVPGMYSNVPLSLYHNPFICAGDRPLPEGMKFGGLTTFGPSISSSGLREIFGEKKSPKHFFASWNGNPNHVPRADSRAFVIGRAVHHLMLGERNFAKLFVIQPTEYPNEHGELKPWHNGAAYCKIWNAERAREGRSWLSPKDVENIKQMSRSISNHPLAGSFLTGQIERSLFWKDKETGIWLKARPDAVPTESADAADLKTTHSTHWNDLQRTMREFAYYRQAALVRDGFKRVLDMELQTFTLVFVEKVRPWHTRDVRPDQEDLHRGDRANRAAVRIFHKCIETGEWPGPGDGNEGNERLPLSDAGREAMDAKLKMEGLADAED